MKPLLALSLALCLLIAVASCDQSPPSSFDIEAIRFYQDIPGITKEEISAIENLKTSRKTFTYGHLATTEAFLLQDGSNAGFNTKLCELLSELFRIEFVQTLYDWDDLKNGLDNCLIDFSGDYTQTSERAQEYYMSHSIAEHSLRIFTHIASPEIEMESDVNGLTIGFLKGVATANRLKESYPSLYFEIVYLDSMDSAVAKLESGEIDAFITKSVADAIFEKYTFIRSREIFPLVYSSKSLATANPELTPVLAVINKYLDLGGADKLFNLYRESEAEYTCYKLRKSFTDVERAYLSTLSAKHLQVKIALEPDNYPVSFYNESEGKFQGIAVDVLAEISRLTGIEFQNITTENSVWTEIMEMLRSDEIVMVSQLLRTEKREGNFLWSNVPYASTSYVLISKSDYPKQAMYQVVSAKVGLGRESAFKDKYNEWFPDNDNAILYDSFSQGMDALEAGEIDLLMASDYMLLMQLNYREKSGYKANIRFNSPMDSYFGFNKNEEILCSIINKAQVYAKADTIVSDWTSRVFDYSRKYTSQFNKFLTFFVIILAASLILVVKLWHKSHLLRQELERKTVALSAVFTAMPDLLFSKDTRGRYTSCNLSFEKMAGRKASEIIGKTVEEVFPQYPPDRHIEMDIKVTHGKSMQATEEWYTYPDGTSRLFESLKSPLVQNGVITGVMAISRDITEHKAAEEAALAASRAKSAFLAHMSHEIRTPMNVILGMTELILREDIPEAIFDYVLSVKHASTSLLSLINDVLDFSRIEAGRLEIVPVEFSFASLLNDILIIMRMKISEKSILFTTNIDCNIPNFLLGDETRLRQILLNVLDNAAKYTNEGFIDLTVTAEFAQERVLLTAVIADSGIGIKEENLDKLFADFVRIDTTKNKSIQGTGLGLAITRNLCLAMGGDVSVSSEYGRGSTFSICLPLKINEAGNVDTREFAKIKEPENKRVLLCETRSRYADSIIRSLNNLGVDNTLVTNLLQLREELKRSFYSYVFVPAALSKRTAMVIEELELEVKLVLLVDFGETPDIRNVRTIAMPVHTGSIANILNDEEDSIFYDESGQERVHFIAPSVSILLVDDVNTNLKVAEGLMLPYQMQIDLCQSGAEAIKRVQLKRYDIIFMDHMMPEMDGIEATLRIRALEDGSGYFRDVPIIALTANALAGVKEMFLQSGMNDFLAKPIDMAKLNILLEKWIPKEKRKEHPEAAITRAPTGIETAEYRLMQIKGIDFRVGITLTGGKLDNYIKTLAIFYLDGLEKTAKIRESMVRNDLNLYIVYTHALKSAAASIGAQELSACVNSLEQAAIKGDLVYILENTEPFLKDFQTLLHNINNALPVEQKTEKKYDPEYQYRELLKLRWALQNMDAGEVEDIMKNLGAVHWEQDAEDIFKEISRNIYLFNYHEAVVLVSALLG